LGFCANVIVKDTGDIAWRLQLGSAFIPSFVLGVGIFFCPESPRWLMKHGKIAKGFRSMDKLRAHKIIAARDYYYSYVIYLEELKLAGGQGYFARMADCFRVPRIRRGNYGASTVMLAQQMCGINSEITQPIGENDARLTHTLHQSFLSTVRPSSMMCCKTLIKRFSPHWVMVPFKSSSPFRHCS